VNGITTRDPRPRHHHERGQQGEREQSAGDQRGRFVLLIREEEQQPGQQRDADERQDAAAWRIRQAEPLDDPAGISPGALGIAHELA
jgi:hypothetical protein